MVTAADTSGPADVPAFSKTANAVPLRSAEAAALLLAMTGGSLVVVGGVLTAPDPRDPTRLIPLPNADALFAWIDSRFRVRWNRGGPSKPEFYEAVKLAADRYACATDRPHFPPLAGVLYTRPAPVPAATGRLDELVGRFPAASAVDRTLIKAAFLTPGAGLPPGTRPCFVITARMSAAGPPDPRRGRGTGKSTLLSLIGQVWAGAFPSGRTATWPRRCRTCCRRTRPASGCAGWTT